MSWQASRNALQATDVERHPHAVPTGDAEGGADRRLGLCLFGLARSLAGSLFAVEYVRTCHAMVLAAHEREFHLVLNVLDMHGSAGGHAPGDGSDHGVGEFLHALVHAGRGCGVPAFHGQKGLGHGNLDLLAVERGDLAVAPDDLELPGCSGRHFGEVGARGHFLGPETPGGTANDGGILKVHACS